MAPHPALSGFAFLALVSAAGAESTWTARVNQDPELSGFPVLSVRPVAEGGGAVVRVGKFTQDYEMVFGADGQPASAWRPAASQTEGLFFDHDTELLLLDSEAFIRDPLSLCVRNRLSDGHERRVLRNYRQAIPFGAPGHKRVLSRQALDASEFRMLLDVGGGTWAARWGEDPGRASIVRIDPDCTTRIVAEIDAADVALANAPDARAAYVLASQPDNSGNTDARLLRIDQDGVAWSMNLGSGHSHTQLGAHPNGDALLVLGGDLHRIKADGIHRWAPIHSETHRLEKITRWKDRLLLAHGDNILLVDPDGLVSDKYRVPGNIVAFIPDQGDFDNRLVNISTNVGRRVVQLSLANGIEGPFEQLPLQRLTNFVRLADGRLVVGADRNVLGSKPIILDGESAQVLELPLVPVRRKLQSVLGSADLTFAVSAGSIGGELIALSADGQPAWSVRSDAWVGAWTLADGRICNVSWQSQYGLQAELVCRSTLDGSILFRSNVSGLVGPYDNPRDGAYLSVSSDGSGYFVTVGRRNLTRTSFTQTGDIHPASVLESNTDIWSETLSENGSFGYSTWPERLVRVVGASGDIKFQKQVEHARPDYVFDRGSEVVVVNNYHRVATGYHLSGDVAWTAPIPVRDARWSMLDDGWFLSELNLSPDDDEERVLDVARLDLTGSTVWNSRIPASIRDFAIVAPGAQRFWRIDPIAGAVEGFDLLTGVKRGRRLLPRPGAVVSVDASGGLVASYDDGTIMRLGPDYAMSDERLALDHASLSGAWHEPDHAGQGLLFEHVPRATGASIAAAWFTYGPEDGRRGLRWYTLAGNVEPGATDSELTIYRNIGGHFGEGTTDSETVGTATISWLACDELELRYDLAESEGLKPETRVLHLRRITSRLFDCGADQPNAEEVVTTGFWHDPSAPGQGLALQQVGPQADMLAGAWFTYDVENRFDDDRHHHWFTMIGSKVSERRYALDILRTIGGRFGDRVGGFNGAPTSNTYRVGTAHVEFVNCVNGVFVYHFDESDWAAEFAGINGTVSLRAITDTTASGCVAPEDAPASAR